MNTVMNPVMNTGMNPVMNTVMNAVMNSIMNPVMNTGMNPVMNSVFYWKGRLEIMSKQWYANRIYWPLLVLFALQNLVSVV